MHVNVLCAVAADEAMRIEGAGIMRTRDQAPDKSPESNLHTVARY